MPQDERERKSIGNTIPYFFASYFCLPVKDPKKNKYIKQRMLCRVMLIVNKR